MKTFNRTIEFLDAENNKVIFEAEITTRNKYFEFTASGQYCGSSGQCFDSVKPANDNQKALIDIWHKYHLNGMNAGTPKQTELTKDCKDYEDSLKTLCNINRETGKETNLSYKGINRDIKYWTNEIRILNNWYEGEKQPIVNTQHYPALNDDFEKKTNETYYNRTLKKYTNNLNECETLLKNTLVYDIDPRDENKLYKYGSAWLRVELPEDFDNTLTELLDAIKEEEEEKKERKVTEDDLELFQDFDRPEVCLALALMLDLCVNEIDDIKENSDTRYTVQGIDYLAGTDEEMEEEWENYLDSYIDECVNIPEEIENFFDRDKYIDYLKQDGRGHSLNSWDGGEEYINLNGVYYYAYRN